MNKLFLYFKPHKFLTGILVIVQSLMFHYNALAQSKQEATFIPKPGAAFNTAILQADVDEDVYTDFVDGKEAKMADHFKRPADLQSILWTKDKQPTGRPVNFGVSDKSGQRHLRMGFKKEILAGTIFTYGGGLLSVLKPGVAYPGNINDDSQWLQAQQMTDGNATVKEAAMYQPAVWVLSAGTKTRAIRFTHDPAPADDNYAGWLGGVLITEQRFTNIAASAKIYTGLNNEAAGKLINGLNDNSTSWISESASVSSGDKTNADWIILSWQNPVDINSLVMLWAATPGVSVQVHEGAAAEQPRYAPESHWKNIGIYKDIKLGYPVFWPNLLQMPRQLTTRGIRLIIDRSMMNAYMSDKANNRKFGAIGEIMVLSPLLNKTLAVSKLAVASVQNDAPIPIAFTLKKAGHVTLTINDKNGTRVRNLIADKWFDKGNNVVYWDGLNDTGRDIDAAKHGLYKIPAMLVEPGRYNVHVLVHDEVKASYEFSVYNNGTPPWSTADMKGGWLADHTPPQSALFVDGTQSPTGKPSVFLGSYITEGNDGLIWVDLDGNKQGGRRWIGGTWTAAPYLAKDIAKTGTGADAYVYAASVLETDKALHKRQLLLSAVNAHGATGIIKQELAITTDAPNVNMELGGLAVKSDLAVISMKSSDEVLLVDLKSKNIIKTIKINKPAGMVFTKDGGLLLLSAQNLLYFPNFGTSSLAENGRVIVRSKLEAPCGIALDENENIFISDKGNSHQVKVFNRDGQFMRSIGTPGAPQAGLYDPQHMNNPEGITIDSKQQLWVAENDYLPKRVSVWSLQGKLINAFYGPSKYGGGGSLDSYDKTKFYYADGATGAMEFKLDWASGSNKLQSVYYRPQPRGLQLPTGNSAPETVLYYNNKRYWTNCFNSSPTAGTAIAFLFMDKDGIAVPIAASGSAGGWDIFKDDKFKNRLPSGLSLTDAKAKSNLFFIWADKNEDGDVQPDEVDFSAGKASGITFMDDLSFCVARLDENAVQFSPAGFSKSGYPEYNMPKGRVLINGIHAPASSGGNQVLTTNTGFTIATLGAGPFSSYSVSGAKNKSDLWSYPNLWPGLHASHEAPVPDRPGELIGTTRLLGGVFHVNRSDSTGVCAINSNHGMVYLFTTDGMFITQLFKPMRTGKVWKMPAAARGMDLGAVTLGDETFWPSITKTSDDSLYIVGGRQSNVIRVEGLNDMYRLPVFSINVTGDDISKSREYLAGHEAFRQDAYGKGIMEVQVDKKAMTVDGKLDDWGGSNWVDIDKSGTNANFNSNAKAYDISASVAVSNNKLYAAFKTMNPNLLKNSGELPNAPFKTGGALDLMIGGNADPARSKPADGDCRLLITLIKGKPKALLYKEVVKGTSQKDKVPFASPSQTIYFDKVEDVTAYLEFKQSDGDYEISMPLNVLGINIAGQKEIKGDIGVLTGDGQQTYSRSYWNNKSIAIISDVPSEAQLTPALWGTFKFIQH